MVQIYYENKIYIYKEIFLWGLRPQTLVEGSLAPDPVEGVTPPAFPCVENCTFFWGVKSSWSINTIENKDI
jgi:hypothetical protein